MTDLDAAAIQSLFEALDEQLAARGTTADIYLVGGAAIALSFDAARTTRDLDAVFAPTNEVRAAARVEQDRGDLALLVDCLGLRSADQALQIAHDCLGPSYPIPPRALYLLEEIFEEKATSPTPPGHTRGANPPANPAPAPPPPSPRTHGPGLSW